MVIKGWVILDMMSWVRDSRVRRGLISWELLIVSVRRSMSFFENALSMSLVSFGPLNSLLAISEALWFQEEYKGAVMCQWVMVDESLAVYIARALT